MIPSLQPYPKRLINILHKKYIRQKRLPMPTSLEGKSRWIVAKSIKRDTKALYRWFHDEKNKERIHDGVKQVSYELEELYRDAREIIKDNGNEACDFFIMFHDIRKAETKII